MKTVSEERWSGSYVRPHRGKRSGGKVARTVAHSSKLKSKFQIRAPGKKYYNLAKNAGISLFFFNSG